MKTVRSWAIVSFVCAGLLGCSKGPPTEVKGTVLLDGQLADARVELYSQGGGAQTARIAKSDATGAFTITEPGGSNTPIQPGTYVVLVTKETGGMGETKNEVPGIYADTKTTPLKVEIASSQAELPPLELTSKPKAEGDKEGKSSTDGADKRR